MEKSGFVVEVLGIPSGFPEQTVVDKLCRYFHRFQTAGGLDLRVLYPCYHPNQAFVIFQDKEVGLRVLQKHSHMLDFEQEQHRLSMKAADNPEVDLQAEATLHLNEFRDEKEVREIVRSYGFVMWDLNRGQVRIMGSFLKLRQLKSHLEQLRKSQNQTKTASLSYQPSLHGPPASSGAVSKHHSDNHSASHHGTRWNFSSSRFPRFSFKRSMSIHRDSPPRSNSFLFDSDVLRYAKLFRQKEINVILTSHNVSLKCEDNSGISSITLLGKEADRAAEKLKELLNHLSKSLRTQEILLKDLDRTTQASLPRRIQKAKHEQVLISQLPDKICIVGTSSTSFEVKQKLLDSSKARKDQSSSVFGRNVRRAPSSRTQAPAAAGAPDYSESKQHNHQVVERKRSAASSWIRGNYSHKVKNRAKKEDDIKPEKENKRSLLKSLKDMFKTKK